MKKEIKGFVFGALITCFVMLNIYTYADSVMKSIMVKANAINIKINGQKAAVDHYTNNGKTGANFCSKCGRNVSDQFCKITIKYIC